MQLWLVLLGSVVTLAGILVLARFSLSFDVQARGEPDGLWLVACGAAVGPFAVATVAGRGMRLRVELHCLGRRFLLNGLRSAAKAPPNGSNASARSARGARPAPNSIERAVARARDGLELVVDAGRRVELDSLTIDLTYGFRDVALTGRIAGALAMISGLLPSAVRLTHSPQWNEPERWRVQAAGVVGIQAGLVLKDLLWYMLRHRFRRRHAPRSRGVDRPKAGGAAGSPHG